MVYVHGLLALVFADSLVRRWRFLSIHVGGFRLMGYNVETTDEAGEQTM